MLIFETFDALPVMVEFLCRVISSFLITTFLVFFLILSDRFKVGFLTGTSSISIVAGGGGRVNFGVGILLILGESGRDLAWFEDLIETSSE